MTALDERIVPDATSPEPPEIIVEETAPGDPAVDPVTLTADVPSYIGVIDDVQYYATGTVEGDLWLQSVSLDGSQSSTLVTEYGSDRTNSVIVGANGSQDIRTILNPSLPTFVYNPATRSWTEFPPGANVSYPAYPGRVGPGAMPGFVGQSGNYIIPPEYAVPGMQTPIPLPPGRVNPPANPPPQPPAPPPQQPQPPNNTNINITIGDIRAVIGSIIFGPSAPGTTAPAPAPVRPVQAPPPAPNATIVNTTTSATNVTTIVWSDGRIVQIFPDGKTVTQMSDGSIYTLNADGSRSYSPPRPVPVPAPGQ